MCGFTQVARASKEGISASSDARRATLGTIAHRARSMLLQRCAQAAFAQQAGEHAVGGDPPNALANDSEQRAFE